MSGGGGSKTQTVTQNTQTNPPDYVQPYLQQTAGQAANLYAQGPQQYYPGSTVVPFSGQTQQALDLTQQRALNGSPVTDAAQNFATSTLNKTPTSQFGNVNNPYLDSTFNKAADQVQNRLNTGFAGSGRNLEAARPAAAQEMGDLANQIYGGAYQNERNLMAQDLNAQRQQQSYLTSLSPQLAQQDYYDLGQLGQVGASYDDLANRNLQDQVARWDYNQQAPGLALDQYIARLNNQSGSSVSTSTPVYTNTLGNVLGGYQLGSSIGGSFGNNGSGWGGLIGAAAGGLL